ncbi:uncharacterized protein LOC112195259 isoform X2 [Rosa chinensis]|nr:uncharacterized protein LOC112195259 isoform X2 [Rosa chinensis]
MNISAPNLKHLRWWGNLMNHLNVGNLMRLEKVELFLSPKVDDFDSLLEVLSGIRRTKVLILDGNTMAMFKEGSMPLPLDEISNLGIHIYSLKDVLVPAMVSLLRGMTNLNTLWITSANLPTYMHFPKVDASLFNMGFWISQRLALVSQLREVRIELANYGTNEFELARYLLEHAHNLKKMVILYPPWQSHLLKKIIRKKIASTARLVLQEKKK